jgi:hypothetical protein
MNRRAPFLHSNQDRLTEASDGRLEHTEMAVAMTPTVWSKVVEDLF